MIQAIDKFLHVLSEETGIPKELLYNIPSEKIEQFVINSRSLDRDRIADALLELTDVILGELPKTGESLC